MSVASMKILVVYWLKRSVDDFVGGPSTEIYPETLKEAVEKISELREKYDEELVGMEVIVHGVSWIVYIYVNVPYAPTDKFVMGESESGITYCVIDISGNGVISLICEILKALDECSGNLLEFGSILEAWLD